MENLKRYIINLQYNLQTNLLTVEVRDSVRGRSKSSVRKLNGLGCMNFFTSFFYEASSR